MATIPRAALDILTQQVNAISADAQAKVARVLESLDWSDIASCRDAAIEAVCMAMAEYGAAAAQASADMYDSARSACVGAPMGAVAEAGLSTEATAAAVRAFVNEINDGNREAFDRKVLERVDWETKRAAANSMRSNGSRDPLRPRFARVPSGGETCRFCIMLASRGPVYTSKDRAGASEHFHPGCDCRIVPFWDAVQTGGSRAFSPTAVEGYDPDALYDEYVGFMGDTGFRKGVARSAARSKGGMSGGKEARPTVHLSTWDRAYKEGRVSFGSIGEVTRYIEGAEDYEDLFERIAFFEREFPEYGIDLGSNTARKIGDAARRARSRLLGKEQMAAIAEHKGPASANGGPKGPRAKSSVGAVYSDVYRARDMAVSKLDLGDLRLKQNQRIHIEGSPQFKVACENRRAKPSCFTLDEDGIKDLIKRHAGHGEPEGTDGGEWARKEVCVSDRVIGFVFSKDGKKIPTRAFKIHYAESMIHAVPMYDKGGDSDDLG